MDIIDLPPEIADLPDVVVPVLRRVYDLNSARYDPLVGDDRQTFATAVYRNSWAQIEQAIAVQSEWTSARPNNSFLIAKGGFQVHFYSWGHDEKTSIEDFRLDDPLLSMTKQRIVLSNTHQRKLFDEVEGFVPIDSLVLPLHELVVIHAGNSDDGCCGVWIGAPLASDEIIASPWAWVRPLWLIERQVNSSEVVTAASHIPHFDLPEPDLDIRLREERATGQATSE